MAKARPVALGFRVHTGWATAVALRGAHEPQIVLRRRVELWDPQTPESKAPYHAALELPQDEGDAVVRRASQAAIGFTTQAVQALADEIAAGGEKLCGLGLVVGSDPDLGAIGNSHVRAHAAEGVLYRKALESGASACAVPSLIVVERVLYEKAGAALGRPEADLRAVASALGKQVGKPWRIEEKSAALAAWMALRSG